MDQEEQHKRTECAAQRIFCIRPGTQNVICCPLLTEYVTCISCCANGTLIKNRQKVKVLNTDYRNMGDRSVVSIKTGIEIDQREKRRLVLSIDIRHQECLVSLMFIHACARLGVYEIILDSPSLTTIYP